MKRLYTLLWLALLAIGVPARAAEPTADGALRSTRFVVYVGVLPAALARESLTAHREPPDSHRIRPAPPPDTHHVVVAVFDAASGQRVTDAQVEARHVPPRGVASTKPLAAMPLGDTLTYGNTFAIAEGRGHRFEIDIRRDGRSDQVTFVYDNLHGSSP